MVSDISVWGARVRGARSRKYRSTEAFGLKSQSRKMHVYKTGCRCAKFRIPGRRRVSGRVSLDTDSVNPAANLGGAVTVMWVWSSIR